MKNKEFWKKVVHIIITILTALLTTVSAHATGVTEALANNVHAIFP